jgi:hypothetical protein
MSLCVEGIMSQRYQVSMSDGLLGLSERFLHGLRRAGSRAFAGAFMALLILPAARGQSITPLYGAFSGWSTAGQEGYNTPAIAPLNLTSLPGWVVQASCYNNNGTQVPLEVTVWHDTGSALELMGAYIDSSIYCGGASIASLNNTSATGYTTIAVATVNGPWETCCSPIQVQAFQVGPSGSVTPIGTPGVNTGQPPVGGGYDWVTVTSLSTSMVATESDGYGLNVYTWGVAANGDVTQLGSSGGTGAFGYGSIIALNSNQAVTATADGTNFGLDLTTWNIGSGGTVTQQDFVSTGIYCFYQNENCNFPNYFSVAPYFLGSGPSVIAAVINQPGDLELVTYGVSSNGTLTPELTLDWDAVSFEFENPPSPSVTFIPGSNLPVVAEFGGNSVFDVNVFAKRASGLYEPTSYHTSWTKTWNASPQGIAPLSNNRVVTATFEDGSCNSINCKTVLYVWQYTP